MAKGADCKSAASWLRRFESCLPHQIFQQLTVRSARHRSERSLRFWGMGHFWGMAMAGAGAFIRPGHPWSEFGESKSVLSLFGVALEEHPIVRDVAHCMTWSGLDLAFA